MTLRDYQIDIISKGTEILNRRHLLYLALEVRTGKTIIALNIAKDFKTVLFVTKKKAIKSIETDFFNSGLKFNLTVCNYESLHKIGKQYDCVIIDEAHGVGALGKKPARLQALLLIKTDYHILLSGTPTPETFSQIYHQLAVSKHSPFSAYTTFYKWAKEFVNVKKKIIAYGTEINDYSDANLNKILPFVKPIMITFTQSEAGFVNEINEHRLTVEMQPKTYHIANRLIKDLVIEGASGVILADTPVKLQNKLHQIYSGTVKLECGKTVILDDTKATFIKDYFKGKKLAIFYKFKAELDILQNVFKDCLTTDISDFNDSSKHIAGQLLSIREGVNLSKADAIVFYNLDFSNVSYKQARDRMTTLERKVSDVYFIFSKNGIEDKIYKTVTVDKKKYDLTAFKKDYGK